MPIKIKIDVTKINKAKLFVGKKGTYLDAVLIDKPDDYGNDGFVSQDATKEERDAGVRGAIIGNWKHLGGAKKPQSPAKPAPAKRPPADPDLDAAEDDIPF